MKMMDFTKLLAQIDSVAAPRKDYSSENEGFWKLTRDKAGNASAVIRFLPNKDISDIPFARKYTHSFKDETTNRWYIENSLSTLGQKDYVGEVNAELWNSGLDENKELCRKRKRKLNFIFNILVIKDAENPSSEGKVFKFSAGKKIFDKITSAAKPDESLGDEPINVFDPQSGADFLLRQTIVASYPNYDSSRFSAKKPIAGGDARIAEVLGQCYDLNLEVSPDKFKTYDELKDKFLWVTGQKEGRGKAAPAPAAGYDAELDKIAKVAAEEKPAAKKPPVVTASSTDDDDDAAFFANLMNS